MMIADVPISGIYFQQGAIARLVVQLIDQETGDPIQLQTATGLSITVLYPDLETAQTFVAQLYTDGSDGQITYVTKNDGVTVDLQQAGLYQMQGSAVIGGVQLPPSYETDFYVLSNAMGVVTPPVSVSPSAMIFYDASNVRWALTVDASGNQQIAATPSGPSSFVYLNHLVMKDPSGTYWTASISTLGVLTWTPGGTFPAALDYFILNDATGKSWVFTITENGQLITA